MTGGGTGIGLATAEELVKGGATVIIASRNQERLIPAAKGLSRDYSADVIPLMCNIREQEEVERLFDQIVERYGRIDFLVNNGGGQFPSPASSISNKGWKAVIDTNLNGTWNMCHAAEDKSTLKHGGKIVNVVADMWRGFPGMAHTGEARAGVVNFTQTLAVEWADKNINVNCVASGVVMSSGMSNYPPEMIKEIWKKIPKKRLGSSD